MESKSQVFKSKYNYAHWREDKPAEAGFSKELISADFKNISDRTDMDSLDALAFPGVDTVYKAMQMNKKKWKNHKWMGTRVGAEYQWLTYNEAIDMAENLSYGMMALDLAPQIEGDTGPEDLWRFVGIQAKNRKEWALTHIANMHQDICTVALYDTLGADATRYILDQTELSTIFISDDFIGKLAKMKIEDMEGE